MKKQGRVTLYGLLKLFQPSPTYRLYGRNDGGRESPSWGGQGVTSAGGRMSAVRLWEVESKAGGSIVAGCDVKHGGRAM